MKRSDQTGNHNNAEICPPVVAIGATLPRNVTRFPGSGKTARFVANIRQSSRAPSLDTVFYRPGSIPLAGDHFCHG
jgi:hypothetical protein